MPSEEGGLGPGSYDPDRRPGGEQVKAKILRDYYRELGAMRDEQTRGRHSSLNAEVRRRREQLSGARDTAVENDWETKELRLKSLQQYRENKAPFNASSDRAGAEGRGAASQGPGPGAYTPINKTIMEGYIMRRLQLDKSKVDARDWQKPDFDWRVFSDVRAKVDPVDLGNYYNIPGAFDATVKKSKKSDFVAKQLQYPASFGSSTKRF